MHLNLPARLTLTARIRQFEKTKLHREIRCVLAGATGISTVASPDGLWEIDWNFASDQPESYSLRLGFRLREGRATNVSIGFGVEIGDWSTDPYVFIPAAAYRGNRFPSRKLDYPPLLDHPANLHHDERPIITDVPRLNEGPGLSRLQLLAGDAALPCLGYFDPKASEGLLLMTDQSTTLGQNGLLIEENDDRSSALFMISTPGVRMETFYRLCSTSVPSTDRGADVGPGEEHTLRVRLVSFPATILQSLFTRYHDHRRDLTGVSELKHEVALSTANEIIEKKYNRDNWREENGYFSVGLRNDRYQDWQAGWVGGLMSTYPLLYAGDETSRLRALRTLDFGFSQGKAESGFFRSCCFHGRWFGDGFEYPGCDHYHMTRKSADVLFFSIKQFDLLQKQQSDASVPPSWRDATLACADAFVSLWKRSGEFGQFVDNRTGDMIVGGSASASLAIAGLAWASFFFQRDDYLEIARQAGRSYHQRFVRQGLLNGGPGEILQCPDSEAAIAMVEAFVALWEVTGDRSWLRPAEEAAEQCLTWQMPYDFAFPPASLFGRLGMRTTGSIWANVQNKHSAPGYCTLSGDSLFKLYRATGRKLFLEAIRETAHNITQYVSRTDRPVGDMPSGWINERVNTSDWLEPPGEIFRGSCWPEIACLLSYIEIPGLYLRTDTGDLTVIDHVNAGVRSVEKNSLRLEIHNPTSSPISLRLLTENEEGAAMPLGLNGLFGRPLLKLAAGETQEIEVSETSVIQK